MMETRVNDRFPLGELECTFYEVCKYYTPNSCDFNQPCPARLSIASSSNPEFSSYISLRKLFSSAIEPVYSSENLKLQVQYIVDELEGGKDEEDE